MTQNINFTEIHKDVQKAVFMNDSHDEVPQITDKINADTLDGHDLSYFASAADITGLKNSKAERDEVVDLKKQVEDLTALVNKYIKP